MAPPHLGLVSCVRWNPTVTCNSRWGRAWLAIFDRQKCNFFFLLLGRLSPDLNFFQPERRRLSTFLSTTDFRIIMIQGDRKSFLPLGHFNSKSSGGFTDCQSVFRSGLLCHPMRCAVGAHCVRVCVGPRLGIRRERNRWVLRRRVAGSREACVAGQCVLAARAQPTGRPARPS